MEKELILKEGRENSVLRGHPWIFSGAIKTLKGNPEEGDWIRASSSNGKYLCSGHYGEQSIALRVVGRKEKNTEAAEVTEKLNNAYKLRSELGFVNNKQTTCYRLVNAEGDCLPGLVVDIYNNAAVIQAHSIGMLKLASIISEKLSELLALDVVYLRDSTGGKDVESFFLKGTESKIKVLENNMQFYVDLHHGQKTGFFIDQRDNRKLVSEYSLNRKVLNCFCYSGGFSVAALQGGAKEVLSADISPTALELLEENIKLNKLSQHRAVKEDCFKLMNEIEGDFDLIVLDPPSLAKHRGASRQAVKAYSALNLTAFNKITAGGLVFTFSCSQFVSRQDFESAIMDASIKSGRNVRILKTLSAATCHARSAFHPEGEYLKGLMLEVG